MKQILQNLGNGETLLVEVPAPGAPSGSLRIATRASLVSSGTERMLLEFGRANLLEKARQQPDRVKQVIAKIKTEGFWATVDAVRAKLAEPIALGYCNAGVVLEVGAGVSGWQVGERVLSNGAHAEVVVVPANLCAKIPDLVPDVHAPFAVPGAIALQGIRLLAPTLGESFMVTGLGLIGLLAVQLLKAHGCRVLGVDFDSGKCALARQFGAETVDLSRGGDVASAARAFTAGRGLDGVLITAATKSSEPVTQAAQACRKRGRIVLVGVTGLELNRADFYEKELSFQVSCSYGPGRYDPEYEDKGRDYPLPYVRAGAEQRQLRSRAGPNGCGRGAGWAAYFTGTVSLWGCAQSIRKTFRARDPGFGARIRISRLSAGRRRRPGRMAHLPAVVAPPSVPVIGVLGAGNFATRVLLPSLAGVGALRRKTIVSGGGVSAARAAQKFHFENSSTDEAAMLTRSGNQHRFHCHAPCGACPPGSGRPDGGPACLRRKTAGADPR